MEGEGVGRDSWNWSCCGNLVQWKPPGSMRVNLARPPTTGEYGLDIFWSQAMSSNGDTRLHLVELFAQGIHGNP